MFRHNFLKKNEIERVVIDGSRFYKRGNDLYPSVTTVLSRTKKQFLEEWKERVGEDKAKEISTKALIRGSAVHSLLESYLKNEFIDKRRIIPTTYKSYLIAKPHLEKNVKTIYGIEHFLYSDKLKAAGTADVICEWDNINSILDFKNVKYLKEETDIKDYFIQLTAYGIMVNELYDLNIQQIVVFVIVDHEENPQIFIKNLDEYYEETLKVFDAS